MPNNTTVTITYANGATREFVASDELEKSINEGEMFSVTTMHSDMSIDEEMSVSKMYVGNPIAAMGNMMIMKRNAEKVLEEDDTATDMEIVIDVVNACIVFMSDEISSHQSGMTPVEEREPCPAINDYCDHFSYSGNHQIDMILTHCTHPDNSKDEEGNTTPSLCPLCTEGGGS